MQRRQLLGSTGRPVSPPGAVGRLGTGRDSEGCPLVPGTVLGACRVLFVFILTEDITDPLTNLVNKLRNKSRPLDCTAVLWWARCGALAPAPWPWGFPALSLRGACCRRRSIFHDHEAPRWSGDGYSARAPSEILPGFSETDVIPTPRGDEWHENCGSLRVWGRKIRIFFVSQRNEEK